MMNTIDEPHPFAKRALVLGGGGFIGSHLARQLKSEGRFVVVADLKYPEFSQTVADIFLKVDLRLRENVEKAFSCGPFDEVYQLAADMGGAGYIFTGANDANVMTNSALINLHVAQLAVEQARKNVFMPTVFFSSSACMYPAHNQEDPDNPLCSEASAYPAGPDSEYGWEKLFSERLYLAYHRNYGLPVRVARYHNVYGPEGTFQGGKEKAPAAMCRKVAEAQNDGSIEVWGDGDQTRSFLYIDEAVKATLAFTRHPSFTGPVNIGSEEMVTINQLAHMAIDASCKSLDIVHVPGPLGVRGRNSDNRLFQSEMGWSPSFSLAQGVANTYDWIENQLTKQFVDSY